MRVAFICTGLEPGRDGVGDYSTLLAQECTRQGHSTVLLSLNDRHIEQVKEGTSSSGTISTNATPYLRLPSSDDWTKRITKAAAFLQAFAPDWVSLQFVCYGFQDKGIVAKQVRHLRSLLQAVRPAKTHLMLHELWIGGVQQSPLKDKVIGTVQQRFVLDLIRAWEPLVIHTSNQHYRHRLESCGLSSAVLPLFSNIPIVDKNNEQSYFSFLKDANVPITRWNRAGLLVGGFFGTLPPEWEPEPILSYLEAAAMQMGRNLILLSAGRMGVAGKQIWDKMRHTYGEMVLLHDIGEQAAEKISNYLHHLDFGIAGLPLQLIGKSSTTATMLDHGIPVIISRVDDGIVKPWNERSATLLQLADRELPHRIVAGLPRLPALSSLPIIAHQFEQSLLMAYGSKQPSSLREGQ